MTPVIRIDDEVFKELKRKAIELEMIFNTPNDVLKELLGLTKTENHIASENFPHSSNPLVQKLLDGLHDTIFNISPKGLVRKGVRWIATPNTVTITVQDARKGDLAISVYGEPNVFNEMNNNLNIRADRPSYSIFNVNDERQLPSAIEVINYSYQLKVSNRGI